MIIIFFRLLENIIFCFKRKSMVVVGSEREEEIIGSERNSIENDLTSKLKSVTFIQPWSAIKALDDILATQSFIKGYVVSW